MAQPSTNDALKASEKASGWVKSFFVCLCGIILGILYLDLCRRTKGDDARWWNILVGSILLLGLIGCSGYCLKQRFAVKSNMAAMKEAVKVN